jgi:small nuclear ribonucleoprotein (snRNP)-like protein
MADVQLVELKNGVTFNGHLVECDNFMNVTLREVYQTSADGERFFKMKEMFIKGNIVRIPSRLRHRQTRWNAVDLTV